MMLPYQSGCYYNQPTKEKPMNDTLRNRLQEIADTLILAIDEMDSMQTKPSPKLTDDEIITKLQREAKYAYDKEQAAFFTHAAKRFKLALAEVWELEEAILDWHASNANFFGSVAPIDRLRELGDIIRKSRKGGKQ
jgi:hypothetical protein